MQIAIIDIGTNTFHLLVSKSEYAGVVSHVESYKVPVKLGENGITRGVISPEAFQRGIDAVKYFKEIISSKTIDEVYAFATSAVRRASNAQQFIDEIKKVTGIKIDVISGELEAEYIYYGVRQAVDIGNKTSLIMDIGGGSVEFVLCNADEIFWKNSFDIGAAILLEKFNPSDPVKENEKKEIINYISEILQPLFKACTRFAPQQLIGSSGSFDTLAEMVVIKFHDPRLLDGKTEYSFNINELNTVVNEIVTSTLAQREQMKGLSSLRINMIVVGAILIDFIISSFNINDIKLSSYALKEGVLWKVIRQGRIVVKGL